MLGGLKEEERIEKMRLKEEFHRLLIMEEISWRQKSRLS